MVFLPKTALYDKTTFLLFSRNSLQSASASYIPSIA
jgi:hypothetical protein